MSLGIFRALGRPAATVEQARLLSQRREFEQAAAICQQILKRRPDDFESLLLLAEIAASQGNLRLGIDYYSRLITLKPGHAVAHYKRGNLLRDSGELEAAITGYDQAIALDPAYAHALCNRGVVLERVGRLDAALDSLDRALALDRGDFIAHYNRATVLRLLGRTQDAIASYDQAIAVNPSHAESYCNRGIILAELEQWAPALESYDKAIEINPRFSQAHSNRGALLQKRRRFDAALESYDKAIAINFDDADAHCGRGLALAAQKNWPESLTSLERAIALSPELAEAYCGRGNVSAELGRHDAALSDLERAIALNARYGDAYQIRGNLRIQMRQYAAAIADYDEAVAQKADGRFLLGLRQHAKMMICDWTDLDADTELLEAGIRAGHAVAPPFAVLSMLDSAALQLKSAQIWVREELDVKAAELAPRPVLARDKIRVGYFSCDFHAHPVAVLMAELFETHDRSNFELIAFSYGPDTQDDMQLRLKRAFDRFIDVGSRTDEDIALLARSLGIDIAVDLGGYTGKSRTRIFAIGAAPAQVNYLGYAGTMGARFMDYLIADETVVPQSHRHHYTENVVYLPNAFLPNDSTRTIASTVFTKEQVGLPGSGFVYCCFNNSYKISPSTFDAWMRILGRVDGSVLWLSANEPMAADNLRREAERRGVAQERLIFAGRMPSASEHLARLRLADLFVDTLPYNAHATAIDALWAGLPVITRPGDAFAGRVAASLLRSLRLPELVASSAEEYENLAVQLAENPQQLADVRQRLERNRSAAPLFDTPRYARDLEAAFTKIHRRSQAGLPPEDIRVESDR